eukprot:177471-Prorocentrum_minimum.AAC.3
MMLQATMTTTFTTIKCVDDAPSYVGEFLGRACFVVGPFRSGIIGSSLVDLVDPVIVTRFFDVRLVLLINEQVVKVKATYTKTRRRLFARCA